MQLCRSQSWSLLQDRLLSHPHEAFPNDSNSNSNSVDATTNNHVDDGTTVLEVAVRGRAPYVVLETLVDVAPSLLLPTHSQHRQQQQKRQHRGTVLHDAIRHGLPLKTVRMLLNKLCDYAKTQQRQGQRPSPSPHQKHKSRHRRQHHLSVQDVLSIRDDMGQTVLHHLVQRTVWNADCPGSLWTLLKQLVTLNPGAVGIADCDGNTPLLLLLLLHHHHGSTTNRPRGARETIRPNLQQHNGNVGDDENDRFIHRMVEWMVKACPRAATMARRVSPLASSTTTTTTTTTTTLDYPTPQSFLSINNTTTSWIVRTDSSSEEEDDGNNDQPTVRGDGSPTPLTYALLYGQSEATIALLLQMAQTSHHHHQYHYHSNSMGNNRSSAASTTTGTTAFDTASMSRATATSSDDFSQQHSNSTNGTNTNNPGLTLATGYHEVPLHIAVTKRSSVSLLKRLVEQCPAAVYVRDNQELTPLDWLWIRHVNDWNSATGIPDDDDDGNPNLARQQQVQSLLLRPVSASTRRYIDSPDFQMWHKRASNDVVSFTEQRRYTGSIAASTVATCHLLDTLWEKTVLLLTAAAVTACNDPIYKQGEPWSIVHAACAVRCPLAMIRMALQQQQQQQQHHGHSNVARKRDLRAGRLPLHYASAQPTPYSVAVPVGATSNQRHVIADERLAMEELLQIFPQGARVTDRHGQLPLHVAIDASKEKQYKDARRKNSSRNSGWNRNRRSTTRTESTDTSTTMWLDTLVRAYPASLERRDGKTKLYPFLQAACGENASMNTIFLLLRENPVLVQPLK